MANTEGLPDEFVESLMTTPSTSVQSDRQRQRLQERMEQPMPEGGRPAATVIRASPRGNQPTVTTVSETETPEVVEPPQVLGGIVERVPTTTKPLQRNKNKSLSRFAQQQQQNAMNGFPSVNLPLGTFVSKNKAKVTPSKPPTVSTTAPRAKATKQTSTTDSSMVVASQRDAENMLKGMSLGEIKEQQQELTAALSPDLVAFLRKRGKAQNQPAKTETVTPPPRPKPKVTSQQEKERIAKLISNVETHQDMDQVYHEVMKDAHPLERQSDDDPTWYPETDTATTDDFALACDLLRSTNPRQNLWAARVVQKRLQDYLQSRPTNREWPLLLPVSLRCLLDQPLSGSDTSQMLHTYVLQALYHLLQLTSRPEHIVDVTMSNDPTNAAAIAYQDCFLDDAVPTPPLDTAYESTPAQPVKVDDKQGNQTVPGAYATSSSSTSAQNDASSFEKDPMWTLLSKMKILPRLAQLLKHNNAANQECWPREAYSAICGILAMISQRSPGAATAIVHHDSILPNLMARTVPLLQEYSQPDDLEIPLATLQLLCTLARQSRVAAKSIPKLTLDLLPPLLARTATISTEFRMQQLGLQLWRTLLRYGLGLEAVEAMVASAAQHLALPNTMEFSLSIEFLSAFAQVLDCVKIAVNHKPDTQASKDKIPRHLLPTLSMASTYLMSTQRQILPKPPQSGIGVDIVSTMPTNYATDDGTCERFRWNTVRLRFLSNFWNLPPTNTGDLGDLNEEIKTDDWSTEHVLTCLQAIQSWLTPGGDVEKACSQVVTPYAAATEFGSNCAIGTTELRVEAAASGFLEALASLILVVVTADRPSSPLLEEAADTVVNQFLERVVQSMHSKTPEMKKSPELATSQDLHMPLAQRGWINQCHFAVSKFFFHVVATKKFNSSRDINVVRTLVFALLGRLEQGQESMAAVLFSQDVLFETRAPAGSKGSQAATGTPLSSPISSMFLGELCGSNLARKQLDHSFKLQHGFGITKDGYGSFALDSLLSQSDNPGGRSDPDQPTVLPIGQVWLWQTLSGMIRVNEQAEAKGTMEAVNVVSAVLALLLDLEDSVMDTTPDVHFYRSHIPLGSKLYHVMNVCLHPESVLREPHLLDVAETVFDRYCEQLDRASMIHFSKACHQHTVPSMKSQNPSGGGDDALEEKDKKLLQLLIPEESNDFAIPAEEMRSMEAFLDDLLEAFNEYGAQYDLFTKCVRLFAMPFFPSSLRCRALRDLRGVLHLLTLPQEMEDQTAMKRLLTRSLLGGLPSTENMPRDPPNLLDAMAATLVQGVTPRPLHGFMLNLVTAILARNMVVSLQTEGQVGDALKKRLLQLDERTVDMVCGTASTLLNSGSDGKDVLVDATLLATASETEATNEDRTTSRIHANTLDKRLTALTAMVRE